MRAALFHEYGGPEVVRVQEVDDPVPGPGEVRLRIRASAFNHLDLWIRRGLPREISMPHIGGSDMAGEVERTGPGVDEGLVGTRVVVDPSLGYGWYEGAHRGPSFRDGPFQILGEHTNGGFAEYAVVPAENLLEVPGQVDFTTAAAASLVGVTAWRGIVGRGRVRPGERLLVTGASGGVGMMGVQVGRLAGATVHAVTSGPERVARVRELGADFVYDRTDGDDWVEVLREDTGGRGVDLVLDSVGQAFWESCIRSLAVGGRLVTYGATTGSEAATEIRHVFWKQLSILGTTMGSPAQFREVMGQVFHGALKPVVHDTLGLDEVQRGHEMLEAGEVFGKLVVVP